MEKINDKRTKELRALAHAAVSASGELATFREQMTRYLFGEMPSGDMFIVAASSQGIDIPMATDAPLVMSQTTMRKVENDHELTPSFVANLPEMIKEHVLALESLTYPNSVVIVLDAEDVNEQPVLVAVHLGLRKDVVTVDEITSMYGKREIAFLVENTYEAKKRVFVNERTGEWISRTGVPFPERIQQRLQNQLYQQRAKEGKNVNEKAHKEAEDRLRRTGVPFPERITDLPQEQLYQKEAKDHRAMMPPGADKPAKAEKATVDKDASDMKANRTAGHEAAEKAQRHAKKQQ